MLPPRSLSIGSWKPTYTDQYLNFNSNHPLIHKRLVVPTLTTRAQLIYVTTAEDGRSELSHSRNAFRANNFKECALDVPPARNKKQVTTTDKTTTKFTRPMLGIPYIQGLSEQLSRTYQSHRVYLFHKPSNTIRSIILHPKDKTPKEKLFGAINHITCDDHTHHTYIGETKRPLSIRLNEHCKLDIPTGVGDHSNATGHSSHWKL